MKRSTRRCRRLLTCICASAFMFQLGSCNLGQVTTTVTLSARDLLINVFRGLILTPIDTAITNAINDVFAEENP